MIDRIHEAIEIPRDPQVHDRLRATPIRSVLTGWSHSYLKVYSDALKRSAASTHRPPQLQSTSE